MLHTSTAYIFLVLGDHPRYIAVCNFAHFWSLQVKLWTQRKLSRIISSIWATLTSEWLLCSLSWHVSFLHDSLPRSTQLCANFSSPSSHQDTLNTFQGKSRGLIYHWYKLAFEMRKMHFHSQMCPVWSTINNILWQA